MRLPVLDLFKLRLPTFLCAAALGLSASAALPALAATVPAATAPAATAPTAGRAAAPTAPQSAPAIPPRDRFSPNQPVPGAGAPGGTSRLTNRPPLQPILSDDPVQSALRTLQSQVMRLQNHLDAVEATLNETPTGRSLTWRCADAATSLNNLGISERCDPFGCDNATGRCRESAIMNNQCAGGAVWDGGISCVYPDRRGPF